MEFYEVTVDYDIGKIEIPEINSRVLLATELFKDVFMRNSASGNGYHLKIILENPIPFDELMRIRHLLKDDPDRLSMDAQRYYAGSEIINVLFQEKDGTLAGEWIQIE